MRLGPSVPPPTSPRPRRRSRGRTATIGLLVAGLLTSSLSSVASAESAEPTPRFPVVKLDVDCVPACTGADIAASNTSRKVAVAPNGTIVATFRAQEGIFATRSVDSGARFDAPVQVTSTSAQPALAVSASGTSYLAWMSAGTAYLAKSDLGGAWSEPVVMGSLAGSNLQLAVDGDHVYAVNQSGTTLLRSTDAGETFSTTVVSSRGWVYSDVQVDPLTRDVFVVVDDPSVSYYRSTDRGATFSDEIAVAAQVFHSVGALTSTPAGPLAYFAGSGNNLERIDLSSAVATQTLFSASDGQARSLGADAFGNVVSGSASGGQLRFEVSQDLGQTFGSPVSLGAGVRANAAINTTVGDVMFLHQTSAGVYLAVYGGLLAGYDVSVDLSAASFGQVGQSRTITITNTSVEDLPIELIAVGDGPFDVADTCGEILAAATSCTATVTATGPGSGYLTVDIGGFQRTIPLTFAPSDVEEPTLSEPTFGDVERRADGFEVAITDHDDALTYTASSDLGEVRIEDGIVVVDGLAPGQTATVSLEVSRDGWTSASATISGTALDALPAPAFGEIAPTRDGFAVAVLNHDRAFDYELSTAHGTATIDDNGRITVTGLALEASTTVTVTVTRDGAAPATSSFTASAAKLVAPVEPLPEAGGDRLPAPGAGKGSVTVDGREISAAVTRGQGRATIAGGGTSAELRFSDSNLNSGSLNVRSSARVSLEAGGLRPASTVTLWVLGVTEPIGSASAGPDGVVNLDRLRLPASVQACTRTFQVTGLTADGDPIGLNLGLSIIPDPYPFGDVVDTSTHAYNVACAESNGLIRGYQGGSYKPADGLRREQFASILARALNLETSGRTASRFPDTAGSVHEGAVAAVADAGLVQGFGDGSFRPRQLITRGQIASILAAASELEGSLDGPFSDVAGSRHAGAINALVGTGVIEGFGDGSFGTYRPVQRAQAASLMVRYLHL